jgi:hypothetical protein
MKWQKFTQRGFTRIDEAGREVLTLYGETNLNLLATLLMEEHGLETLTFKWTDEDEVGFALAMPVETAEVA